MKRQIFILLVLLLTCFSSPTFGAIKAKRVNSSVGMTVLLLESHSLPMVQVDLLVRAGSILDPTAKSGLSYLTATLLEEGTENRTSKDIANELDAIGSDFVASPSNDYSIFSMKILKKDLNKGMLLFSDILTHPVFPNEELLRAKNALLSQLLDQKDDPQMVASLEFDKAVYGNHPYHHPVEGDESSIKNISQEDLIGFYKSYYNPKSSILVVVGDLSEAEAKALVERYFVKWSAPITAVSKYPVPLKTMKKNVILIDKDLAQTSIVLGNIGISRLNPDFYPLQVMNYILGGGGFSSRMLSNIRDNKGLVYELDSHFYPNLETGSFKVILQTKNSTAKEAISEVLNEMRRIQNEPVSPEELQDAKDYLIGSFPLKMDTYRKLGTFLVIQEFYGLGSDYFEKYTRWINDVNIQEVQRVARQYLDPDHFVLVAVGKMSEARIDLTPRAGMEESH